MNQIIMRISFYTQTKAAILSLIFFTLFSINGKAQTYIPVTVSGFNADGIAEIPTNAITCTADSMDNSGDVMYSATFAAGCGILGGIINTGTIVSGTRTYQLMPFNGPNVLFDTNGTTKIMTITTPAQFTKISLLCFSTEMASTVNIVLRFTDGTIINSGSFIIQDWYNGTGAVYSGFGDCQRIANVTTSLGPPTNPNFYPLDIDIPCGDQTKFLDTITFINTNGAFSYTKACFMGLSAVPYQLSAIQSEVEELCFGASTGSLTVNVTSNSLPLAYVWSTNPVQTTSTASNLVAGTYILTVTDVNGCTSTYTDSVTQPTQIHAAITDSTEASCNTSNGSATVTATGGTGGFTYIWNTNPVQTTNVASNIPAATYIVTVTDANNCTATASITITQTNGITSSITAHTNVLCNGGTTGSLTVTGVGSASYTYVWNTNPVQNTATASHLPAGIYFVTVTAANGCISISTDTITKPPLLAVTVTSITNDLCFGGNNGQAIVQAAGGTTGYTYQWNTNPAQATATASTLPAGTYIVTVTDANNCITTTPVTITQPPLFKVLISSFVNISSCGTNDGSATATTTGGTGINPTYVWSTNPAQNTATASNLPVGTYTVIATDANGCTATTTVNLIQPGLFTATTSPNISVCNGTAVVLSVNVGGGTAPYTYNWNPGGGHSNTMTVIPAITTNYSVTVTDASGCILTPAAIVVTVNASPNVSFSADVYVGCDPLIVNFTDNSTVGGGDSVIYWYWNFGDGDGSISENPTEVYTKAGVFSVSLICTSSNGCTAVQSDSNMITVYQRPFAQFTANTFSTSIISPEIDFTDESSNAVAWQWYFGDGVGGNFSIKKDPIYTYSAVGIYNVTLIVKNLVGCTDSIIKNVFITQDFEFYIPNSFTPNGDGLNDIFIARGYNIETFQMDIFNRWGENIFTTTDISNGWDGTLPNTGSAAVSDVYVYNITVKDGFGDFHKFHGKVSLIR